MGDSNQQDSQIPPRSSVLLTKGGVVIIKLTSQEAPAILGSISQYLEHIHSGLYIANRSRQIIYWNRAAEQISGYSWKDITNTDSHSCLDTLAHISAACGQLCFHDCPLEQTLKDGQVREAHVYLHHKQGHLIEVFVRIFPIRSETGVIIAAGESFSLASQFWDPVCSQSEFSKLIAKSQTDTLTGLKNRCFGESFLSSKLQEARESNLPFALLFFDIDNFKFVNDQYGHDTGDLVLKTISSTLLGQLRPSDTFIRWGGDEFIIVFGGQLAKSELKVIANRLCCQTAELKIPNTSPPLSLSISLGVTQSRTGDSVVNLVKRADQNMYISKRNGGNQVTIHFPTKHSVSRTS